MGETDYLAECRERFKKSEWAKTENPDEWIRENLRGGFDRAEGWPMMSEPKKPHIRFLIEQNK